MLLLGKFWRGLVDGEGDCGVVWCVLLRSCDPFSSSGRPDKFPFCFLRSLHRQHYSFFSSTSSSYHSLSSVDTHVLFLRNIIESIQARRLPYSPFKSPNRLNGQIAAMKRPSQTPTLAAESWLVYDNRMRNPSACTCKLHRSIKRLSRTCAPARLLTHGPKRRTHNDVLSTLHSGRNERRHADICFRRSTIAAIRHRCRWSMPVASFSTPFAETGSG